MTTTKSMTTTKRTLPHLLVAAALLAGCATLASHDEYASYRSVRMAEDERSQLIALQHYAEHHPNGIWTQEIAGMRAEREDALWLSNNTTREGLEWYLRIYPDGQYVDQARPRLAALQTVTGRRAEEAQRQRELEQQQRQEAAEARRTWVTRAMQFWLRTLLEIRQYGSSLGRVASSNPEFSQAFGNPPAPVVTPEYAIKHYGQLYHIPVPGATRIDRHIDVYLRLSLDRGRLQRAELLMPNKGFSRWYEMENQTVVTDEDPEQRMMAINWALDRLQPIIQQAAPGAQQIDFVPEPMEPLQVHGEAEDTEVAPAAPDEPPAETPPAPTPAETPEQPEQPPSEFDELLSQASGTDTEQPAQPAQPVEEPEAMETLVLPIGLLSFRHRNLRVVVFAAGDEDYGAGFDGVFFEPQSE